VTSREVAPVEADAEVKADVGEAVAA